MSARGLDAASRASGGIGRCAHRLSLVVPAFDEEARLPATLRAAAEALPRLASEAEIVVVDDGSSDSTSAVASRFASPVPLRVLRLPRNRGKGFALARGIAAARHPLIAFTDADCPYDLGALAPMLDALASGAVDVAIGARDLPDSQVERGYGWMRWVSGKGLSALTWLAIGLPFRDSQCGLKAFRAGVARDLFAVRTVDRFGFDFEILAAAVAAGLRVGRFPVRLTHHDASRVDLVRDSLRMAADLYRVRRNLRRGAYRFVPGAAVERPCPLCEAEEFRPVAMRDGFRMVECRGCGLWYLNPMPTPATLIALYEESYFASASPGHRGYSHYAGMADDLRATFARRLALVDAYVGQGRLLDVGAGFGYLADAARDRFAERWALELSAAAANRISPEHRVVVAPFESADLPRRYFDVVSMQDCLEHFRDVASALRKARELLRPGGALLAVTPDTGSWLARLQQRRWVSLKFPEHVVLFSESTLRRALDAAGFRVQTMVPAGQYVRLDFVARRVAGRDSRLGTLLGRAAQAADAGSRRLYVPSGSLAVVATADG
ncbi:MAG: bifunctional glycosyltransferase/class I SAM-dependent methyltransferase [Thermodesulfobacteriota bacterium]